VDLNLSRILNIVPEKRHTGAVIGLLGVLAITIIVALATNTPELLVVPIAAIVGFLAITDYKKLFLILWATIPLSTEVEFGSIGTDLPDEILMIALMGVAILIFIAKAPRLSMRMMLNPITLLLILHVAWIGITTFTSTQTVISLKFFAAKLWYVGTFYFLSYYLIRGDKDMRKWFKWLFIPVLLTVAIVWIRHAGTGFSFDTVEEMMKPFYRNKVDYALMLGVITPFAWYFRDYWKGKYTGIAIVFILLIGVYFAYTRAAYLGLVIGAAGLLCIHTRTLKFAILLSVAGLTFVLVNLAKDNRYIDYAPEYSKTISHKNFDNLLEATYKLEDISSMERVYRWVAGFYMIGERPWLGFGPGAFYESYMPYTDNHFLTYVSDNPERSGVHNYFLMTATDQGLPGLVIFVALLLFTFLKAQWLYTRLNDDFAKKLLNACIVTLIFIVFVLLLNDMVETDKVGSFFFFSLAMIVALEERYLKRGNDRDARIVNLKSGK